MLSRRLCPHPSGRDGDIRRRQNHPHPRPHDNGHRPDGDGRLRDTKNHLDPSQQPRQGLLRVQEQGLGHRLDPSWLRGPCPPQETHRHLGTLSPSAAIFRPMGGDRSLSIPCTSESTATIATAARSAFVTEVIGPESHRTQEQPLKGHHSVVSTKAISACSKCTKKRGHQSFAGLTPRAALVLPRRLIVAPRPSGLLALARS